MRYHLFLSAVGVAAAMDSTNATLGALADRVEWSRVNNKASYDWPNSTLRHFWGRGAPLVSAGLVGGSPILRE